MGSNGGATRFHHHNNHRLITNFDPPNPNPQNPSQQIELSEQDIFNSPSGIITITPKPTPPVPTPRLRKPTPQTGLLAALSDTQPGSATRPGSMTRPVFNHKPVSTSPAGSISIPRRLLDQERQVSFPQSAPISVPIMSKAAMRRNVKEFDDVEELEEEEEDEEDVWVPPHELVAQRESPMFSNSVLEGVGRTLKGRDLRQVRNAIWRKTGFLD